MNDFESRSADTMMKARFKISVLQWNIKNGKDKRRGGKGKREKRCDGIYLKKKKSRCECRRGSH